MTHGTPREQLVRSIDIPRATPVQARSQARVTALLDAAATVVGRVGIFELTTNMVTAEAGASIGTLYRYFPDRAALLRALAARTARSVGYSLENAIEENTFDSLEDVIEQMIDLIVESYRREPGFAAINYDGALGRRIDPAEMAETRELIDEIDGVAPTMRSLFAFRVANIVRTKELPDIAEVSDVYLAETIEAALSAAGSLVNAAFIDNRVGDRRLIKLAKEAASAVVAERLEQNGGAGARK